MRKGRNHRTMQGASVALAVAVSLVVGGFAVMASASASTGSKAGHAQSRRVRMAGGTVTAVNAGGFAIQQRDGSTKVIVTNADTKYSESGNPAPASGVAVGDKVLVKLTDATTATASKVAILLASLGGKVVSTSASAITVTDGQGFTRTVNVSSSTAYFRDGKATTLADVKSGDGLRAFGTVNGSALDAKFVHVHTPAPPSGKNAEHRRAVRGTVTAVGPTSFSLKLPEGTTKDIATNTDTRYAESGSRAAPTGVAVGDNVMVKLSDASTPTAAKVLIVLVQLRGTVASVSGSDITLRDDQGFARTVHTAATTVFTKDGKAITLADVVAGQRISAYGHVNGAALDAKFVNVHDPKPAPSHARVQGASATNGAKTSSDASPPAGAGATNRSVNGRADDHGRHVGEKPGAAAQQQRMLGVVQSVTDTTIVVKTQDGQTKTITVTPTTAYRTADNKSAALTDIKAGDQLMAFGTLNTDGTLTAAQVLFRSPGPDDHHPSPGDQRGSGFAPGGPGGDPRGGSGGSGDDGGGGHH